MLNFQINKKSKYAKKLEDEKKNKRADMHSFHRYYGKLIPAIPATFINPALGEFMIKSPVSPAARSPQNDVIVLL